MEDQRGEVDRGDAYKEVAGELAEFFVLVHRVLDDLGGVLGRVLDELFGLFAGEHGAE